MGIMFSILVQVLLFVAITLHTIRQNKATKVYKYTTRSMLYVYVCMDRCY